MPVKQICGHCNTEFSAKKLLVEYRRYCGVACAKAAKFDRVTCKHCGKQFDWYKSQGKRVTCSDECRRALTQKAKPPKVERTPTLKTCMGCGKEFRVPPVRKDTAKYCSRACTNKNAEYKLLQSSQQQRDRHWRWSGGRYLSGTGYVSVKRKVAGRYANCKTEHRLVMAQWIAESDPAHPFLVRNDDDVWLRPDIEVHHIDRNRANNARKNLLAVAPMDHARIHHKNAKPTICWPSNPSNW